MALKDSAAQADLPQNHDVESMVLAATEVNADSGGSKDAATSDGLLSTVPQAKLRQGKVKAKPMDSNKLRYARMSVSRYRLVGEDGLLLKACTFTSAKSKELVTVWPIVVPASMVLVPW